MHTKEKNYWKRFCQKDLLIKFWRNKWFNLENFPPRSIFRLTQVWKVSVLNRNFFISFSWSFGVHDLQFLEVLKSNNSFLKNCGNLVVKKWPTEIKRKSWCFNAAIAQYNSTPWYKKIHHTISLSVFLWNNYFIDVKRKS